MPYITQAARNELDITFGGVSPRTAGELNYEFTNQIVNYWELHKNYQGINDILGALEGAKMEFYRRVVVPYEDKKIEENGDVY